MAAEIRKIKKSRESSMAILGSGSIVSQLAQEGLIDEYQIVVNPIVLGKGQDDVRRHQGDAALEAGTHANLRQWKCPAVLRAKGMKGERRRNPA